MLGQLARIGTGSFDLLLNVDECKKAMQVPVHARFDSMMPSNLENSISFNSTLDNSQNIISGMTPWNQSASPSWGSMTPGNWGSMTPAAGCFSPGKFV